MASTDSKRMALAGAVIAVVTVLAFWPILNNGFISYDDTRYFFENDHVRSGLTVENVLWSLTSTYDGNWFPLTWISHMIDVSLFGFDARGHHLTSLLLHVVNALLLFWMLNRVTGYLWRSAAVAALFALHPLHVESVAWAAERKDVLCALFLMLTLIAYGCYASRRSVARYLCVVFLYACGLASKPMLVTVPLLLFLLDLWPLGRLPLAPARLMGRLRDDRWLLLREKVPFLALSAVSCLITLNVQKGQSKVLDVAQHGFADNAAHAMVNYASYLGKLFWPVDLAVIYPYVEEVGAASVAGAVLLLLALSALALRQRRNHPQLAVGWFWFLVTLVPVVGFVKIGEHSIADRYSYLPFIGVFLALVWGAASLLEKKHQGGLLTTAISVILFTALAAGTWRQCGYWKESATLFQHALEVTKDNYVAHINLGTDLIKSGRPDQALPHFSEAARLNPQNPEVHYNLGIALDSVGDESGAIQSFRRVLEMNPDLKEAHFYLGVAYTRAGNIAAAVEEDHKLEVIAPEMAHTLKDFIDSAQPHPHPGQAGQHG